MEPSGEPRGQHATTPSLQFDHRGHRVGGEIDLDNRVIRPVSLTTDEEWDAFNHGTQAPA